MSANLEQAVDILTDVRVNRTPLGTLPENCRPETEEQAYSIQSMLQARLEDHGLGTRQGYKIGCTTAIMQDFLKIDQPCAGGIMANTIYHHSAELQLDDYQQVGVECEIAVRLGEDIVVDADNPVSADDVSRSVESCMAAMEIVDNRYADYAMTGTPTLIADGFFGAGCILGEEITNWRDLDLEFTSGRLMVNGTVVGSGIGSAILGHPLNALCWLANHLAQSGQMLKAGEVVLLGSIVLPHWVNRGESIVAEIDDLGRVEVVFR